MTGPLGHPRLHLREVDSTNARASRLAEAHAPSGTLVTAAYQSAGRGRLGRTWVAPPGTALLMSVVVRPVPVLLPLRAAIAVAAAIGPEAAIKWPNDVLVAGRKVSGILVEGRPQEGWAVVGVGVNVALPDAELPPAERTPPGTLGRPPKAIEPLLEAVLAGLGAQLEAPVDAVLEAWRERDALLGQRVTWASGAGVAAGIDDLGRLRVRRDDGGEEALGAGEVSLEPSGA